MKNIILILIILAIVIAAIVKIVREKRKGVKCIGCPYSQACGSKCNCDDYHQH